MKNNIANSEIPDNRVMVAGLSIHYRCLGKGHPVFMIHGGGNDWHEWKRNLTFMSRGFQVYAIDLPGFGLSQPPEHTVSSTWIVDFLKNVMDNLGIVKAHLVGHSMGAMISIAFTAQYPESVNKLVLIDPSGLGDMSRTGRLLISFFRTLDNWRGKKRGPKYTVGSMIEEWQVLDKLPKIESPVLIVWGQNDIYLPVSQSRLACNLIPNSRLCIFPLCGHAPQRERAEKFNNLIMQFLSDKDNSNLPMD